MSQRWRVQKSREPYLSVVEMLRRAFDRHVDHRFTLSADADEPDLSCVYCHDCDMPVVMGSREMIELVWLDAMTGPPVSH